MLYINYIIVSSQVLDQIKMYNEQLNYLYSNTVCIMCIIYNISVNQVNKSYKLELK